METAIKPTKRLEEGEERRFAPHCILATKRIGFLGNLHLRYPILVQAWAQRARSIAFLRGPRNYPFSDRYLRLRGLRMGDDNLASIWRGGRRNLDQRLGAVTGQRSNQLNYVPTLFSSGLLETNVF